MNNFLWMFSTAGIRRFSGKPFFLRAFSLTICSQMFLLIIGFCVVKTSLAVGHEGLQITDIVQFPSNPVTPGDTVRYTLTVESTDALNSRFGEIRIRSAGQSINSLFVSDECYEDGYGSGFYCPEEVIAGQPVQYTFTWQPSAGQHDLVFSVDCSLSCTGDSQSISTNVVPPSPGTIQFSSADYQVSEEDGQAAITVTRIDGSAGVLSVRVLAGVGDGDTATMGEDYSFPSSEASDVLRWSDGDTDVKILYLDIVADSLVEGDETVTLQLQDLSLQELAGSGKNAAAERVKNVQANAIGSLSRATLTIRDSTINPSAVDQLKTLSGNYQRGVPGGAPLTPFVITAIDASGNPVTGVSVDWEVLPANGGGLQQQTTVTDAGGRSSNTLTLNTSDRLVVRATVGSLVGSDSVNVIPMSSDGPVSVTFVVNGGIAEQPGLSENQRSVARAMDTMCPALKERERTEEVLSAGQSDLLATCRRLETDDLAAVGTNLDLLAHEEVSALGRVVIETAKLQSVSIHRRLTALRAGARGVNLSGLTINIDGQTLPESVVSALFGSGARGGSAGEEAQGIASRWGAFVNANVIIGDRGKTGRETGFDFRARGVTAGADYRISDALVVGSALGYASKDSDFKGDAGNLEMDSWHLSAYGSYYRSERFYLDGLVRLGRNSIDTDRRINLPGDPLQEGVGSTTGWEYAASLSGGYEYSRNALTAGPYGRLGFIQTSIDGYTESASNPGGVGAGSILAIDDQDVDSITAVLGGQVTYAISARSAVYLLQLNGEWEHEFTDNSRAIAAQFVYDPTRTSFDIRSDNPDRNYFNLGLGVTAVFANGRSGFIHYESRLGQDDVRQYWINGGIRIEL